MSAKIKIETEDRALAAALGMVIARAIQDAGFANTKAKMLVMSRTGRKTDDFNRVSDLILQIRPEEGEFVAEPPELDEMRYMAPPKDFNVIERMKERNADIIHKPIVLSIYDNEDDHYAACEAMFLNPPPPPPAPVTQGFGESP